MPRKAPKEVIEHRITLGDFERKQLVEAIDSYQRDKVLENVSNLLLGGAGVIVAGTIAAVGYAVYYYLDSVPSIIDSAKDALNIAPDKVTSIIDKAKSSTYSRYSTLEEVNAAWDEIEQKVRNTQATSQRFLTLYDAGEIGTFHPTWFVNAQRNVVANSEKELAKLAVERSDYIARWQEYMANQTSNQES